MIELSELVQQTQTALNANTNGVVFQIFGDTDNFLKSVRSGNTVTNYINGLMQVMESNIAPTQELVVATQTARLEFVFPIDDADDLSPIQDQIEIYRAIVSSVYQKPFTQAMTDSSGKQFSVCVYGAPATTGERLQRPIIGDSMSLVVYLYYSFIENGINSLDCPVYLDGVQVPYSSLSVSRVPTMEGNPYSDDTGAAKNRIVATALSVTMTVPATSTGQTSASAVGFLLNGTVAVHTFQINIGNSNQTFNVYFGQIDMNAEGVRNAGFTINLIEAVNYGTI